MAKMAKWRRHPIEFKRQAVERMKECDNICTLARELDIERKLLYKWKYQFEGRPEPRHANPSPTQEEGKRQDQILRDEIARLQSDLVKRTRENDFFRAALLRVEGVRQSSTESGGRASTKPSKRGARSKAQ